MARPLPERDVHALFDVIVVFSGELLAGQASPDMTARMIRRLAQHGVVSPDASVGELFAVVDDLCQRLRYAMGEYHSLPEPSPRETTYYLLLPTQSAAQSCQAELVASGAGDVSVQPTDSGMWQIAVTFADLAPDPAFRARQTQLDQLARSQGGQYSGAGH